MGSSGELSGRLARHEAGSLCWLAGTYTNEAPVLLQRQGGSPMMITRVAPQSFRKTFLSYKSGERLGRRLMSQRGRRGISSLK